MQHCRDVVGSLVTTSNTGCQSQADVCKAGLALWVQALSPRLCSSLAAAAAQPVQGRFDVQCVVRLTHCCCTHAQAEPDLIIFNANLSLTAC